MIFENLPIPVWKPGRAVDFTYRGKRLRTSLDVGYQKKTFHGGTTGLNISGVDFVPEVPDPSKNYSQKWRHSDIDNEFGVARVEYDLTDTWTSTAL